VGAPRWQHPCPGLPSVLPPSLHLRGWGRLSHGSRQRATERIRRRSGRLSGRDVDVVDAWSASTCNSWVLGKTWVKLNGELSIKLLRTNCIWYLCDVLYVVLYVGLSKKTENVLMLYYSIRHLTDEPDSHSLPWINIAGEFMIIGSRPSDHYFRIVCWFVCLFVQSFSQPSLIRFRSHLNICYMSGSSCVP